MAQQTKMRAIQIDAAIGQALENKAAEMTQLSKAGGGKRVTIKALVEEAVLARWPDLRLQPGVATMAELSGAASATSAASTIPAQPVDPQAFVFDRIIQAVLCGGDGELEGLERNAGIEALDGTAVGSFGQEIKLRDLAYHLRAVMMVKVIGSLGELVRDYEEAGV